MPLSTGQLAAIAAGVAGLSWMYYERYVNNILFIYAGMYVDYKYILGNITYFYHIFLPYISIIYAYCVYAFILLQ